MQQTSEALLCAQADEIPSLSGLEDLSPLLSRSAILNQILEGTELYRIYRFASLSTEVRNLLSMRKTSYPVLGELCRNLPDLRSLQKQIEIKIEPTGEVKEDASPELKRLHKEISHLKARLERSLEKYLRDPKLQAVLQEDYVTYRHGRAVLLVRIEQKNAIRGVVHGISGSGASLFVEPFPVLELNNELAQLLDEQLVEINRVLRELTELVGAESGRLKYTLEQLIRLDLIFARGRFGKAFRCTIPEISEKSIIRLRNARHPLLENTLKTQGGEVVPLDLDMDESKKALVITGPNTGGKTVFLKTIGLLSVMAHYALPIPSDEGSVIPRFSAIEADIGDQQSISESLSTFSSHIRNIRAILINLRDSSLILLDELGTGTDPEEGAPLAVAILQELLRHKIKIAITSHHSQVKMFAFNHPECITAAMEFDEQKLQPTYRVHLDQTGSSHAFEIAEKLGLPAPVLQSARNLVSGDQRQLQEYQSNLQQRTSRLMEEQQAFQSQKEDWVRKAREEEEQMARLRSKLDHQLKNIKEQNVDLIRTLNARVENLLAEIQDAGLQQQLRKQYREQVEPAVARLQDLTPEQPQVEQEDWKPGERVWTNLYRDFGELVQVKKGQAELIIRNKRFVVPVTTLERKKSLSETLPQGVHVRFETKEVEPELNLIGQTVDEALSAADKYLDDAFLNQLAEVRFIHGHGTGKLRKALEEMLQTHPHVRSFHPESPQRGGTGVTVVQLRT